MRIQVAQDFNETRAVIKVIGVGGAGGNAINRMVEAGIRDVELVAANSDAQALRGSQAEVKIQLGETVTGGLGVGGDPAKGRAAALESEAQLREVLAGADMVFVTTGMGGGTGTGGAPIVARIAKELGALTVGVVTRPFGFEGIKKSALADEGIAEMRKSVDTLLLIPNDKVLEVIEADTLNDHAFKLADDVLRKAVQCISDVITRSGHINVDLNDLRKIMKDAGDALIGIGEARGAGRHLAAAKAAVESPLLENVSILGAKGLIVNIAASKATFLATELTEVGALIAGMVSPEAETKIGTHYDDSLGDGIQITVIAAGLEPRRGGRVLSRPGLRGAALSGKYSSEASDARLVAGAAAAADWTKPAYLRLKVRKLK